MPFPSLRRLLHDPVHRDLLPLLLSLLHDLGESREIMIRERETGIEVGKIDWMREKKVGKWIHTINWTHTNFCFSFLKLSQLERVKREGGESHNRSSKFFKTHSVLVGKGETRWRRWWGKTMMMFLMWSQRFLSTVWREAWSVWCLLFSFRKSERERGRKRERESWTNTKGNLPNSKRLWRVGLIVVCRWIIVVGCRSPNDNGLVVCCYC